MAMADDRSSARALVTQGLACISRQDWPGAADCFRAACAAADPADSAVITRAGTMLERLGEYGTAWDVLARHARLQQPSDIREWAGGNEPGHGLEIRQYIRDLFSPIRHARLVPLAARYFRRTTVVVEPRMVPLYRRSYPDIDVRAEEEATDSRPDVVACHETLCRYLTRDDASIRASFAPLAVDRERVAAFRARYAAGGRPCVGISWASSSTRKDMPSLECWTKLVASFPATFVSLQYGDTSADRAAFAARDGEVIQDTAVDQLVDLDTFAAQVAALDAVVSISNTPAHMTGALGVPALVITGEPSPTTWPYQGETSPWYPHTKIVRRRGRAWDAVFVDIERELSALLRR
jgi:hypothetical protein